MEVRLESARLLTWKAAMLKDAGKNFTKVSSVNKTINVNGMISHTTKSK